MLGGIEMLKHGVTSIQDNSSGWFTSEDKDVEESYWRAYEDLGVRASIAIGLLDRSWLEFAAWIELITSTRVDFETIKQYN